MLSLFIFKLSSKLNNKNLQLKKNELKGKHSTDQTEGIKYYVPKSLTSSSEYWKEVENNGFLLSAQFGAPTIP